MLVLIKERTGILNQHNLRSYAVSGLFVAVRRNTVERNQKPRPAPFPSSLRLTATQLALGLVDGFNRPGGALTGVTSFLS